MRARFLALMGGLVAGASVGHAQGFDFSQMQQLMQNPQVQQMVQQQVQQRLGAAGTTTKAAPALSTQQTGTLAAQAQTIAQGLLTPAEQNKLQQFQATPEGASIVAKLPQLMQQLAPVMLQMYAGQGAAVAPAAGATNPITWTK